MSTNKKVKIDPMTQAKQAKVFFTNLLEALGALEKLVKFNITDIDKTLDRLNKEVEKKFEESDNQTKMY